MPAVIPAATTPAIAEAITDKRNSNMFTAIRMICQSLTAILVYYSDEPNASVNYSHIVCNIVVINVIGFGLSFDELAQWNMSGIV
jgi:hypothetical protein